MLDYYRLAWPVLRLFDPERAHTLAVTLLRNHLLPVPEVVHDPVLKTRVFGLDFANPIGLAAGFDKNAEVIDAMLAQGFGFVEAGSVTPLPQPGNDKPRMFRLAEDRALINRLGFNNQGIERVAERLEQRLHDPHRTPGIVGLNLGKNKEQPDAIADYVKGISRAGHLADYLVVNVSSPNTPGLRSLQTRAQLTALVRAARSAADAVGKKPLLVKIAPDLDDTAIADIAEVALAERIDGLVVGNTTLARDGLKGAAQHEQGGLSGAPLFARSTQVLAKAYSATGGKLPLIGVGGVASGADAYAKIRAGASLVQLYSALVFGGVALVLRITNELATLLRRDGFFSVREAVGQNAPRRS